MPTCALSLPLRALPARCRFVAAALAFATASFATAAPPPPVPAGDCALDKAHSSLVFRIGPPLAGAKP